MGGRVQSHANAPLSPTHACTRVRMFVCLSHALCDAVLFWRLPPFLSLCVCMTEVCTHGNDDSSVWTPKQNEKRGWRCAAKGGGDSGARVCVCVCASAKLQSPLTLTLGHAVHRVLVLHFRVKGNATRKHDCPSATADALAAASAARVRVSNKASRPHT